MKSLESVINEEVALAAERIIRASRAAALAALEQRFDVHGGLSQPEMPARNPAATTGSRSMKRTKPNRSRDEIAALEKEFIAVVRSNPGGSMGALASQIGVKRAELQVPIKRLKAKKKIKLVGQRQFTCYFPVEEEVAA